jgi:hypothetical protein
VIKWIRLVWAKFKEAERKKAENWRKEKDYRP